MSDAPPQNGEPPVATPPLTTTGRLVMLIAAFLGWFCAGWMMSITSVAMEPAVVSLLDSTGKLRRTEFNALNQRSKTTGAGALSESEKAQLKQGKALIQQRFGFCTCAFLFGAAAGGLVFGGLGDRIGRSKAMAASILTYSLGAGAASMSTSTEMLIGLWFLACMGVGGMWPTGVALVSEAWSSLSRPLAAGLIGTAANIGIFLMATLASQKGFEVSPDHWRWFVQIGAWPVILGLVAAMIVPESPRWLASRNAAPTSDAPQTSILDIFRPPFLGITLIGIVLATIPIFGGWGTMNWMVPWAAEEGRNMNPPNELLKAQVSQYRSVTGMISSLLGGWIASVVGRRRTYLLTSVILLAAAQYTFWYVTPHDASFLFWVAFIGFFSGIYFGFLPLFLPELFPTRVRSTGSGVSFNFGRILTAVTVFATALLKDYFHGDYAKIGRVTSLAFAAGIVAILFAPDTSQKKLDD